MATKAVKTLAAAVAADIREYGHLQDVDDPAQKDMRSVFRGAYHQGDRNARKGLIQALNRKVKVEKREEFKDDFGPIAALMAWQSKTPTVNVLEVLDSIAGEKDE